MINKFISFIILFLTMMIQTAYAVPPLVATGDIQIVVDGYLILPNLSPVTFQNMNAQNAYLEDASQSQSYSIQSTFSSQSTTPNVSVVASIDHNHVDLNGAYLVNTDNPGKVYFTVNYQSCGPSGKAYPLVTLGSTPLPKIILKNKEVSTDACQKQSGQLFFIRSALKNTPEPEPLPPSGVYTGQITLTVQATSET